MKSIFVKMLIAVAALALISKGCFGIYYHQTSAGRGSSIHLFGQAAVFGGWQNILMGFAFFGAFFQSVRLAVLWVCIFGIIAIILPFFRFLH